VGGQAGDQTGQESTSAATAQVLEPVEHSVLNPDVGPSNHSYPDRHGPHHQPTEVPGNGRQEPGNQAHPAVRQSSTATDKTFTGLTEEEQGAMKARTHELKAETRRGRGADTADGEPDVLAKIAELPPPDRALAQRLHAIIKASAPALSPKTWYGMPAYAKDGKVVCFFQAAHKFKTRYATFGFNDAANLDDGTMWPTAFALTELTAADEAQIAALVKKAVS
jgi:uncharacterized protein YdhG (YjbR/CyaY superfamily)